MSSQSYAPYRGCHIKVHVTLAKSQAIGGICRRYRVSWAISSADRPDLNVASFPERFDFLSVEEAFKYGAKRAHTYIDSALCTPSQKRLAANSLEHASDATTV